ncbi:MAG: hypothetical protein WBA34_00520, partial [Candidatus Deferrimicrobiaceae bacterium]
MTDAIREIGVGIIGFGTVGSGTARLLLDNADLLRRRVGIPIRLVRVADIDVERDRGVSLPDGILTTKSDQVIRDPSVHIVVELVGGTGAA